MTPAETLERLLAIDGLEPTRATPFLTDEPKLPVYVTRKGEDSWGQGAHPDPVVARIKAAAEALERHCLLTPADDDSVTARYGELSDQIDPVDFFCYSREQTPDYQHEIERVREAEYHWASVRDYKSGHRLLIPREFVYLDAGGFEPRRIRRESITSGAALGIAGSGDAFGRALFELIERDAFMGVWLQNESPARIGGFSGEAAKLISWLERYRLDCRVFDLRGPLGVPAVLALTLDWSEPGPAATSGLAAEDNYDAAVSSAILESISYRRQVRIKAMSDELPEITEPTDITSVETRIAYWSRSERLGELPSWVGAAASLAMKQLSEVSCPVTQAVQNLTGQGCRVLQADITTPEAEVQGFEAVRVIVPELHPLYLSEAAKALHSARLGSVPTDVNPLPHPFA